jgi:hypothetical protein
MNENFLIQLSSSKADYIRDGYAIIPAVFSTHEMNNVRAEAYDVLKRMRPRDPSLQMRNGFPALLFGPDDQSSYLRFISNSRVMRAIVRFFLGMDVLRLNNQIYFRESGDEDQFAWHQDICFRTPPEDFSGIEDSYLQTIICVDDIDGNGAIEFVPGSHRCGNLNLIPRDNSEYGLREFSRGEWRGVKVAAKSGDVLLWSVMTVHGSEPNTSGRNRMTLMNGFAKASAILKPGKFPHYATA